MWHEIVADTQFPLPPGAEVSLSCSTGHTLSGDRVVTCVDGENFSFTNAPSCTIGLKSLDKKVTVSDAAAFFKIWMITPIPQVKNLLF